MSLAQHFNTRLCVYGGIHANHKGVVCQLDMVPTNHSLKAVQTQVQPRLSSRLSDSGYWGGGGGVPREKEKKL